MVINNLQDLRNAYVELMMFGDCGKIGKNLKKSIRDYNKRTSDRHVIKQDFDYSVWVIDLPEEITSKEAAEDYFKEHEYIERYYTYYDCTGRPFTSWYRVFERNGRWIAYHSIGIDV